MKLAMATKNKRMNLLSFKVINRQNKQLRAKKRGVEKTPRMEKMSTTTEKNIYRSMAFTPFLKIVCFLSLHRAFEYTHQVFVQK